MDTFELSILNKTLHFSQYFIENKEALTGILLCVWLQFHGADGKWSKKDLEIWGLG